MAHGALRKSTRVVLTVAAAMAVSAQAQDPCETSTFNGQACQLAIRHNGYCSGGAWARMSYQWPYPYYYNAYSAFVSGGGLAAPSRIENCPAPGRFSRGGFGSTGAGRHAGG